MQQLTVRQLADWLSDTDRSKPLLIDVREPWELELCRLDGILDPVVPGGVAEVAVAVAATEEVDLEHRPAGIGKTPAAQCSHAPGLVHLFREGVHIDHGSMSRRAAR